MTRLRVGRIESTTRSAVITTTAPFITLPLLHTHKTNNYHYPRTTPTTTTKREAGRQLELLGAAVDHADAAVAEFLPNGGKLSLVAADAAGCLSLSVYDKADPLSWRGRRLLARGAAHVGALVTRMVRLRMDVPGDASNRQALLYGTRDGGLGVLAPFWDADMFKRLASAQAELAYRLPHAAGLNPVAFHHRYGRAPRALGGGFAFGAPLAPGANTMLHGDLLWRFAASLDLRQQASVAEAVGVTRAQLLDDLRALAAATAFL
jgi:cleavage and polyadenylation specificity factor subunit 1